MPVDPKLVEHHPLNVISKLTPEFLDRLKPEARAEANQLLIDLGEMIERNPLYRLTWKNDQQVEFLYATTPIQAAFCGNRFGKTTALVIKTLVQCLDANDIPDWLLPAKKWFPNENTTRTGTAARVVVPTFDALHSVVIPAFMEWCPKHALKGGSWGKAFNKQLAILHFANGSFVDFKTYQQEPQAMAGAALHMVGYDEPPPWAVRRECRVRLTDFGGFEMFAMTPLNVNTSWVRKEIWRKRAHPDITVIKGSIWDNPLLDRAEIERTLSQQTEVWRRAVEFGDFIDLGGLVYPEFERAVVEKPPILGLGGWTKRLTSGDGSLSDVVCAIDPGIRNAAFVWIAFDSDNCAYVFAEALLQDSTPVEYAELIHKVNKAWGLSEPPLYIIDPAARQRAQINADTVQSELMRQGIPTVPGQNDIDAGINQVRQRIAQGRLWVNPQCRGLRDEADDYALEDRPDGVVKPIKGNDHRLDAFRYGLMARPWQPFQEDDAPKRQLGWEPGTYDPDWEREAYTPPLAPLGEFS